MSKLDMFFNFWLESPQNRRAASLLTAQVLSLQRTGPCNVHQNLSRSHKLPLPKSPSSNIHGVRLKRALISRVRICSRAENNSVLLVSKGILLFLLWELVSCKIKLRNNLSHQSLSLLPKAGGCSESAQSAPRYLSAPLWNAESAQKC